MKIFFLCDKCLESQSLEHLSNDPVDYAIQKFYPLPVSESCVYEFVCDNGHLNEKKDVRQKFQILLVSGTSAIMDGYLREGILSYHSALERFLEFCIKVWAVKLDIDHEKFEKIWARFKNSSERQLGAFSMIYLFQYDKIPECISDLSKFRNRINHQGYFPSLNETYSYCDKVLKFIADALNTVKDQDEDHYLKTLRSTSGDATEEQILRVNIFGVHVLELFPDNGRIVPRPVERIVEDWRKRLTSSLR